MNNQILVPLDGSALAEAALPHAIAIARATAASLVLLRAIPRPAEAAEVAWRAIHYARVWDGQGGREAERSAAEEYLERLGRALQDEGLEVQTLVKEDEPARAIVIYVEGHPHITMIVMSTHG